jgi:MinD-like ATPase involved in chromosome partitioning or flagellar assembly
VPNIASFFTATDNSLQAATQTIGWGSRGAQVGLQVILGPTRPRDGEPVSSAELSAVIETARCESECVVVDVPSLTPPATSPWTRTPLKHATDIVLVMAPTVTGISAAVEALSTLSEIPTAGRVSVLLNQRAPGGAFSTREFRAAVESIWRGCPEVTRVGFVPELPGSMNEGQMPDSDILGDSLKAMGDFIGLPGPEPAAPRGRKGFSLGRLRISLGG